MHTRTPSPIIYLDLKPEHIIICEGEVKIIDFNSAYYMEDIDDVNYITGTKGFAAPELYEGNKISLQSDIFSIGAVLYYMACKKTADIGKMELFSSGEGENCSRQLKRIIGKCLKPYDGERYSSASELKENLKTILNSTEKLLNGKTSLKIAVAGSRHGIGSTHVSVSLTSYLNREGITSLYKERKDSGFLRNFKEYCSKMTEKNGLYMLERFKGCPYYGEAVRTTAIEKDAKIIINDYGVIDEENIFEIEKNDVLLIVADGNPWEISSTRRTLERVWDFENVYILFNFTRPGVVNLVKDALHWEGIYYIPYDQNLINPGKSMRILYEKLIKKIGYGGENISKKKYSVFGWF